MTTTQTTARDAFIADAKATASRAGLSVPERLAYVAAETARYNATHTSMTTTQSPSIIDRIVRGTVVLRSGAERDAYRIDGVTYFMPVGARQDYRKATTTLALTFRANVDRP